MAEKQNYHQVLKQIESLRKNLGQLQDEFQNKFTTLKTRIEMLAKELTESSLEEESEHQQAAAPSLSCGGEKFYNECIEEAEHESGPVMEQESSVTDLEEEDFAGDGIMAIALQSTLFAVVSSIFGPLTGLFNKAKEVIAYYREQGKLPVFFMTLAGIITLVLGVGYILQYSFVYLLGPELKLLCSFIGSMIIGGLGIKLYYKEKLKEYASALIGVSIVLNYLVIYFLAIYYGFVSANAGFSLLIANTIAGYFLARIFETRIVTVIYFIGGSFTPFILGIESSHPAFYLFYLFILAASTLHVARYIQWPQLSHTSFIIVMIITEYILYETEFITNIPIIFAIHALFYLYCYHCLFAGKRVREKLDITSIILLAGNITLFLFNLKQLIYIRHILGIVLIGNAVSFIILEYLKWPRLTTKQRALLITLPATFIALAIPAIFNLGLMALFWAQEGLILIFLGFLFSLEIVRKEGYGILAIAFFQVGWLQGQIFKIWPRIFVSASYWNGMACGAVLLVLLFLLNRYKSAHTPLEKRLLVLSEDFFSIFILMFYGVTIAALLPSWYIPLCLFSIFFVLYWAHINRLIFSRFLAATLYLLVMATVVIRQYLYWGIWPEIFNSFLYWNVMVTGMLLWLTIFVLKKYMNALDRFYKNFYLVMQESFSFLLALEFMISAAAITSQWFLCLVLFPMLYIIYRGKKLSLPYSQYLGTGLYFLLLVEISRSFSIVHSFLFVKQTPACKVAIIEAFALLWAYQFYLEKIKGNETLLSLGEKLRTLFYLLIPVSFLQHVMVYYQSFFPLALWGSSITAYLMQKLIKKRVLRAEFFLLTLIAAILSIVIPLRDAVTELVSPASAALLAGTLFCSFLLWYEGAFDRQRYVKSPLQILFNVSWIYFAAVIFLLVYTISNNLQLSGLAAGFFWIWLIRYQPLFLSVRPLFRFFYHTGKLLIIGSIIFLTKSSLHLINYNPIRSGISLIGIGSLIFLVYFNPHLYRFLGDNRDKKNLTMRNCDLWLVHIFILIVYINSLLMMNNSLVQPLISIFLLIHAIFLLFHSRYVSYRPLSKLALVLFAAIVVKVILFDMVGFTQFQKIIAFMIMAAILLGTAYILQKQNLMQPHKIE